MKHDNIKTIADELVKNNSTYTRADLAKINTAGDEDKLREAMLELTDKKVNISKEDFDLFIQGKKQIEI